MAGNRDNYKFEPGYKITYSIFNTPPFIYQPGPLIVAAPARVCAACGVDTPRFRCGGAGCDTLYCGTRCQRAHWHAGHHGECGK